ncbi:hypothetical protein [Actinomadura decatromicini]|uniref:DUF2812 domain-containing protein n=1 Tax=Actinomadura decatromicini TaxID=2604572 RepID=A0A5D3FLC8_9ACTN|nr:hypothetical protein [Actinomadura decatromicini]TYK49597.1 hypothetical protein FXF68_17850 [Actinomadura decatromicini]
MALTVDDLAAYVTESGTDPVQEFGTPEEFAPQVAPSGEQDDAAPPSSAETWTWRADAFHERDVLNRYGDEGWEVERVDGAGRFVSHRDPENPQRWEYHRETVLPGRGQAVIDRLAPDGWESCGTWVCFEYFKRPKAATIGPEAALRNVPRTPAVSAFWSGHFRDLIAAMTIVTVVLCLAGLTLVSDLSYSDFGGSLTGMVVGALSALAISIVVRAWLARRRKSS